MADRPKLGDARKRVLELSYPPTTLMMPPARAVGHRLASPVVAKANLPSRPFALVDGLAVLASDVISRGRSAEQSAPEPPPEPEAIAESGNGMSGAAAQPQREREPEPEPGAEPHSAHGGEFGNGDLAEELVTTSSYSGEDVDHEDAPEDIEQLEMQESADEGAPQTVTLQLRPMPQSNRKEDALAQGQAIPVRAGGEVPRGGELIIPFSEILGEPDSDSPHIDPALREARTAALQAAAAARARAEQRPRRRSEQAEEIEDPNESALPAMEPRRDWDAFGSHTRGEVTVPRYNRRPEPNFVSIGGWMRPRQEVLPERTLVRAGELALLEALSIDEVEIYRKPVVGIASLSPPMPHAQRRQRRSGGDFPVTGGGPGEDEYLAGEIDPLAVLAGQLCRNAQLAALPLGFAPPRFRGLALTVERWLEQVDVLLLVGGSHLGPRSLGQDVIAALGELQLTGMDLRPGGPTSAGMIGDKPVFALPGSLPDVVAGLVLLVRPLLHKYNPPHQFMDSTKVELEGASRLRFDLDMVLPVKIRQAEHGGYQAKVIGGRRDDPWLRYMRGQALVVIEGGSEPADDAPLTAYLY